MKFDGLLNKIKGYTDVVVENVGRMGKNAASKTENVVSQAKVKYAISETNNKLDDIYISIGKKIYEEYLVNGTEDEQIKSACEKIDALNRELDDLNIKMSQLKSMIKCEYCGAYNGIDGEFCSQCGAKLSPNDIVDDDSDVVVEVDKAE